MTDDERMIRIETKLDVLISQHTHTSEQVSDHETRLRAVERAAASRADVDSLDGRLRAVEHDTVTEDDLDARTRRIWVVLGVVVSAAGVLVALVLGLTR